LWEVADLASGSDVVFLGEQPDVVAEGEQPLERRSGFVVSTGECVVVGEPERAGQERTLARWQSVGGVVGLRVAVDEPVLAQLSLDRGNRSGHTWIIRRQEPDERHHQQHCVELGSTVGRADRRS